MNAQTAPNRLIAHSGNYQIVRCKGDIQFILERRRPGKAGRAGNSTHDALAYIYNADNLAPVIIRESLQVPRKVLAELLIQWSAYRRRQAHG